MLLLVSETWCVVSLGDLTIPWYWGDVFDSPSKPILPLFLLSDSWLILQPLKLTPLTLIPNSTNLTVINVTEQPQHLTYAGLWSISKLDRNLLHETVPVTAHWCVADDILTGWQKQTNYKKGNPTWKTNSFAVSHKESARVKRIRKKVKEARLKEKIKVKNKKKWRVNDCLIITSQDWESTEAPVMPLAPPVRENRTSSEWEMPYNL